MDCFKDPVAIYNFGRELQAKGRITEAEQVFRKTVAQAPGYAEAHAQLGQLLRARGNQDEAETCFRAAIAAAPGYAEIHLQLGQMLRGRGRQDEAEACFRAAIAAARDFLEAHEALGVLLEERGRLDDALASYNEIWCRERGYVAGVAKLISLAHRLGRDDHPAICWMIDRLEEPLVGPRQTRAMPMLAWYFPCVDQRDHLAAGGYPAAGLCGGTGDDFRSVVVAYHGTVQPADPERFAAITAGATVIEVSDLLAEAAASMNAGRFSRNGVTYLLCTNASLQAELSSRL